MNESKETCAPENVVLTYTERWQRIDRRKAEDYVRKLQANIRTIFIFTRCWR